MTRESKKQAALQLLGWLRKGAPAGLVAGGLGRPRQQWLQGDPQDPSRHRANERRGRYRTILNITTPPKGTALHDAIIGMERLFIDYEATSGSKLSEHLKIATLRRLLPAADDSNYEAVKQMVSEYEVADRRFEPLRAEAVYDHGGVAPMEVDQIKGFGGKWSSLDGCVLSGARRSRISLVSRVPELDRQMEMKSRRT